MSIKKRDVVFIGKTADGDKTIDMPFTRLGNIEDDAELKENPTEGDYIPIIDVPDNGQMKKTPYIPISKQFVEYKEAESDDLIPLSSGEKLGILFGKLAKAIKLLSEHILNNVRHITAEERKSWNEKASGSHTHTALDIGALTNIKIGTVTTGVPGSQAEVSANTVGTISTLNLTIPKGDKGETGLQGPKGDTGARGLQGDKGDTGATGPQGLQGPKGAAGATGAKGATGTRGSRWYTGTAITGTSTTASIFSSTGIIDALINDMYLNSSTGATYKCTFGGAASTAKWAYIGSIKGATGSKGATGATDPQGVQDPKGATGATGAKGATGPQGPKGDKGDTGPQGPAGNSYTYTIKLIPHNNSGGSIMSNKNINNESISDTQSMAAIGGDSVTLTSLADLVLYRNGTQVSRCGPFQISGSISNS